jgi:hypothetical protein
MGGQEVWFHAYLNLAPGGGQRFASNTCDITKAQVLSRQEAGWARQAVLKIKRKEKSVSLARNQTSTPRTTSHSLCYYSESARELILYQDIKNFQNRSFMDYKILHDNNTIFSFIWITSHVQILPENNRQERNTSSHKTVEITILRSKKEWRYYGGTREEFTDTILVLKKKVGKCWKWWTKITMQEFWIKFCMERVMLNGQ